MTQLDVLYEDNHLLVVDKPAELATMGADGAPTVHSRASQYIRDRYQKPGKVFLGIVSRLDSMTTGVLVLARTSKAASRLVPQFGTAQRNKKTADFLPAEKIYLAVIQGKLETPFGNLTDLVRKDDAARRMRVVESETKDSQIASLDYLTIAGNDDMSVLAVKLSTGRKHQIRVQFADRGHAVIGDRKYGSNRPFPAGVALHSWRTTITHPTKREQVSFQAELPDTWQEFRDMLPPFKTIKARTEKFFA